MRWPARSGRRRLAATGSVLVLLAVPEAPAQSLTQEEKARFLRTARVVDSRLVEEGTTEPWRLTLSDGELTHDALFQSIDLRRDRYRTAGGKVELFFVDSYRYNISAYRLARLLGLGDMVPVTVERIWRGTRGALSWWIESKWDGEEIYRSKMKPPEPSDYARQMSTVAVFAQLIHDTDRNLGNLLVTEDWKVWMIDFTRSFRIWKKLPEPEKLLRIERSLLERLKALDPEEVEEKVGPYLRGTELRALLARRDLIVEHFEKRIAELGEASVLY